MSNNSESKWLSLRNGNIFDMTAATLMKPADLAGAYRRYHIANSILETSIRP